MLLDLELLKLLLDAIGDELLNAAVSRSVRRAFRPVEQAGVDLDLDHASSLLRIVLSVPLQELEVVGRVGGSASPRRRPFHTGAHVEKTDFPTIDGGVGKPNSARIEGARSTSE